MTYGAGYGVRDDKRRKGILFEEAITSCPSLKRGETQQSLGLRYVKTPDRPDFRLQLDREGLSRGASAAGPVEGILLGHHRHRVEREPEIPLR